MIETKKIVQWDGKSDIIIKGDFGITMMYYKIDGVRALWDGTKWVSRNGKPLYNMENIVPGMKPFLDGNLITEDVEVFCGSLKATLGKVRSKKENPVLPSEVYSLTPSTSERLAYRGITIGTYEKAAMDAVLKYAVDQGYEGIVIGLNTMETAYKLKQRITYDVRVSGRVEGRGKYQGMLGAFETEMGKVGTGFNDSERDLYWAAGEDVFNWVIEVECMELTTDGKFRHPRFVRVRFDKD